MKLQRHIISTRLASIISVFLYIVLSFISFSFNNSLTLCCITFGFSNENNSFLKCITENVRENRKGNQKLTIQRHWQHLAHKTQDEDKQNTKTQHNTKTLKKKISNTSPPKNKCEHRCSRWVSSSCFLYDTCNVTRRV